MSDEARRFMAQNIAYHMNRLHISRADLCKALDFKYSTLSAWLSGTKYPRIDKIEAMAKYFGITSADLVYDCTLEQSDVFFYKQSAQALVKQLTITEKLQNVLNEDDDIGDFKYSDDQLNQILDFAKFLKGKD